MSLKTEIKSIAAASALLHKILDNNNSVGPIDCSTEIGILAESILGCQALLNKIKASLVGEAYDSLVSAVGANRGIGEPVGPMNNIGELDIAALDVTVSKIITAAVRLRDLINDALNQQNLPVGCWEESFDALHKLFALLPKRGPTVEVGSYHDWHKFHEYTKPSPDCFIAAAPGYEQLVQVFAAAHDQAAYGKGKERHANGLPFHEQRMQGISDLVGSPDGMLYQLVKKTTEGLQFEDPEKREHELFGALNYLAGIVIWLRRHEATKPNEV